MLVGILKEIKVLERRVSMTPAGVIAMINNGHEVIVEKDAGAGAGYPEIERRVGEILQDLDRRGPRMDIGVGLVLELAAEEPTVFLCQPFGQGEHARTALRSFGQNDLGAEEAHQLAALDREVLGHGDDERISLLGADHGKPNAGVP